ncbi:MAG TPA: protein kinase, partial [Longimicrobium sp.]|nr:protein kinase [Longimicrobium sp.]
MAGAEQTLIGRSLEGRFTLDAPLGRGRSGLVFAGRDAATGAEAAVKVLAVPRDAEARERFRALVRREAGAAAALAHPHVAAVLGFGTDPEIRADYVATELLRGERLSAVLAQRGRPPLPLALRILGEAAAAVGAGHRAGLVHRDLRPASLFLVRPEGERQVRVKLLGFGVPQMVSREGLAAQDASLRAYAPPEQLAAGSARLGPASDVFALG